VHNGALRQRAAIFCQHYVIGYLQCCGGEGRRVFVANSAHVSFEVAWVGCASLVFRGCGKVGLLAAVRVCVYV